MNSETIPKAVHEGTNERGDYLLKRHMSEGERRRNVRWAVRDLTDVDLDARNARVWRSVYGSLLVHSGETAHVDDRVRTNTPRGREISLIRGAAFVVCQRDHGIPANRLAELAGISHSSVGAWVRGKHADRVGSLLGSWRGLENDYSARVVIQVTQKAAEALASAALESGESPAVIASAAILAACELSHTERDPGVR